MNNLSRVAIIAIVIVLVLCAVGAGIWAHTRHEQPAKLAPSPTAQAATNKPALLPASTVKSTEPSATQMSLAIAHKGEGVESTFIRQFAADPVAYGFDGKQDAKAIHKWAGRQAHLLAIKTGYYDWKFGAEVGASAPDKMAFVIQKNANGNLTVVEYAVTVSTTASPTFTQGATHIASATVGASNFFGASPITGEKLPVPHGEYVHFPG